MCVFPSTFLTPFFKTAQDKLTEKQAIPVLGLFPSMAKAGLSLAQIVAGVALTVLASLALLLTMGFLGGIMVAFIDDGLQSVRDGFKGLGFSLANIGTLTILGCVLKHRT